MTVAVGAATVAMGAFSAAMAVGVKQASDLQQSVANIKSIKPEIDSSRVFSSLNLMQTRVAQSSKQMADSLYNIFSSMDVGAEDGLRLVEKFAKGATAAMTDANTFGTAITGVLNAYKLGVADADHISDVFFNTVKRGVVTGQELAMNLGLVTQSAKAAGVGVNELGAFIAAVTKEGGPAAQNINNLNNLFLKINTKEAAAGFKEIGIQVFDATGKMRPALDILSDLRGKLVTYTESAATASLQKIFPDLQARAGALTIMNQLDTVRTALEENQTATGSTATAYATMVDTFENQSRVLGQTVQSILISGGNALLPALSAGVKGVEAFVKDTAPLFDTWQSRINTAFQRGGFDAWLKEVGAVAGELGKQLEKWIPEFANWAGKAKDRLTAVLNEVWTGTIVPWIAQKAQELGTKFNDEWGPAIVAWLKSEETATKIRSGLDAVGVTVSSWADSEGVQKFKEIGHQLGAALIEGLKNTFVPKESQDLFNQFRQWMQEFGAVGVLSNGVGVTPVNGPGASSSGESSAPTPSSTTASIPSLSTSSISFPGGLAPNQFGGDQGLTLDEAAAACGPVAAVAFARAYGRNPTLKEAVGLARNAGLWDASQGMHGAGAEQSLMGMMGVPSTLQQGVDWKKAAAFNQAGIPVAIDTPNHYFLSSGFNPESGQFNFGATGTAYRNGAEWMTPSRMNGVGAGAARSMLFPNSPPNGDYHALANAFASQYGLDPGIFSAMLQEEHGFQTDTNANSAGARGIAQFMPGTARGIAGQLNLSEGEFWNHPANQLQGAALYLSQLQSQFGGDTSLALAAYNTGPGNVAAGRIPSETQAYVARILAASRNGASPGQTLSVPGLSPAEMDDVINGASGGSSNGGNPSDTEGVIGGGTFDPRILTPEKLAAAFGSAQTEAMAGEKGRALIKAFDDAIEGEKPHALEALGSTLADLKNALLGDSQLSPEDAQQRFAEVMNAVSGALIDGSDEAVSAAKSFMVDLEQSLALDKVIDQTTKKANVALENATEQITQAYQQRDKAIGKLQTSFDEAKQDRTNQEAMTDWLQTYTEGTQRYVEGEKEKRAEFRATQVAERSEREETAAAEKQYNDARQKILDERHKLAGNASTSFVEGMGGVKISSHTDPDAAFLKQLKDMDKQHTKDMADLTERQAQRRADHLEDVQWQKDDKTYYQNLEDTVLKPARQSVRQITDDYRDAYQQNVQIPRQIKELVGDTEINVNKINTNLDAALQQIQNEGDTAIARLQAMHTIELPKVEAAAGTVMDPAITDANTWIGIIREGAAILGNSATSGASGGTSNPEGLDNGFTAMASGGIVTRPTLALIGEGAGPEAVIPLSQMASAQPQEIHVHVEIGGREIKHEVVSMVGDTWPSLKRAGAVR